MFLLGSTMVCHFVGSKSQNPSKRWTWVGKVCPFCRHLVVAKVPLWSSIARFCILYSAWGPFWEDFSTKCRPAGAPLVSGRRIKIAGCCCEQMDCELDGRLGPVETDIISHNSRKALKFAVAFITSCFNLERICRAQATCESSENSENPGTDYCKLHMLRRAWSRVNMQWNSTVQNLRISKESVPAAVCWCLLVIFERPRRNLKARWRLNLGTERSCSLACASKLARSRRTRQTPRRLSWRRLLATTRPGYN